MGRCREAIASDLRGLQNRMDNLALDMIEYSGENQDEVRLHGLELGKAAVKVEGWAKGMGHEGA